ncbi:hypothetical protein BV22DRAFT_130028 [Leucogyrophana mollusca]|uniref:Uncharacterized protein n=1 Tax=Leucogyrophana mollusca TaxID=85980 RepID=A0ACB8BVK8_9AGAM|nr:hypothetical protein BV22DRAFT_130028 [Leucogyrophana mollusca]
MHRCLHITDILHKIASKIYDYPVDPSSMDCFDIPYLRRARADLASLARTCRIFRDPALDSLWSFLKSFDPLIRCLPQDLWVTDADGFLVFTRPLSFSDWAIFQQYARRVRIFGEYRSPLLFKSIGYDVLRALSGFLPDGGCFLPNLRQLNWPQPQDHMCKSSDTDYFLLLPLFLGPRLTCLYLESSLFPGTDLESEPSTSVLSIVSSLHASSPLIKEVECVGTSEKMMQSISESISQWPRLGYVEAGALSQHAITHLCALKSLKHLGVHLDQQGHHTHAKFPSTLESFKIVARSSTACQQYLEDIHLTCGHLCVHVASTTYSSASSFQQFFTLLSSHLSAADLHTLDIGYYRPDLTGPPDWSLETLKPLFVFRNLTTFRSSRYCTAKLSDPDLEEIALAWPQLEVLKLGTSTDWRAPALVTFTGILSLLRHCRRLRELSLTMDATILDAINTWGHGSEVANYHTTLLDVGDADIREPALVAEFLSAIMPRLTKIAHVGWAGGHRRSAWLRVEELLKVTATARERGEPGRGPLICEVTSAC